MLIVKFGIYTNNFNYWSIQLLYLITLITESSVMYVVSSLHLYQIKQYVNVLNKFLRHAYLSLKITFKGLSSASLFMHRKLCPNVLEIPAWLIISAPSHSLTLHLWAKADDALVRPKWKSHQLTQLVTILAKTIKIKSTQIDKLIFFSILVLMLVGFRHTRASIVKS